jgi:prepilin signal peptidase PulO-like enzyme (type II secretory pathway)
MAIFILYLFIFIFGASIGSFAGVVVARHNVSSPWKGRSKCMHCGKSLSFFELVPIFSYLFLKGRCKKCGVKIGKEYFFIELFSGFIFVLAYQNLLQKYFDPSSFDFNLFSAISFSLFFTFLFFIFLIITFYYLKHKVLRLIFYLWLIAISLAVELYKIIFAQNYFYNAHTLIFWLDAFSGFLIALPFFIFYFFSKGKAVGGGDVLIFFGMGYLAGFIYGVSIFLLSVWIGALFSICLVAINKKYNRKSEIPFAPFIVLATLLVLFWKLDIMGLAFYFS